MDKQTFYAQLAGKLTELGVGEEYINRHLTQFDGYFSDKSDEEVSEEIAKLGSIDRVAARIKRITDKMISDESQTESPADAVSAPEESTVKSEAPQPPREPAARQPQKPPAQPRKAPSTQDQNSRQAPPDDGGTGENGNSGSPVPQPVNSRINRPEVKHVDDFQPVGYTAPDPETLKRNTQKFRIIFAATLPLTLAVLLAIAFLFGAAFFAIAVLIIAAVGLLVAMTAAGTLASVFGLIFGVAQMISSMPIGLYECGLSIIIGSSVLFCGILVYNFAVRLMPYAAKWLLVFAKFVVKKLKELYIYLKKECIGI